MFAHTRPLVLEMDPQAHTSLRLEQRDRPRGAAVHPEGVPREFDADLGQRTMILGCSPTTDRPRRGEGQGAICPRHTC